MSSSPSSASSAIQGFKVRASCNCLDLGFKGRAEPPLRHGNLESEKADTGEGPGVCRQRL